MNVVLAVFLGGGLGSLSRFGVSIVSKSIFNTQFPIGTFLANMLSLVVMGLIVGVFHDKITNESVKAFLLLGFCGGFSTFSTFSFEPMELLRTGQFWFAALSVLISVIVGLLILYVFTYQRNL